MKRFMQVFLAMVGVVSLSIVSSLGVYHYYCQSKPDIVVMDTTANVQLEALAEQVINPALSSVDEILQFRQCLAQQQESDSIFTAIPLDVLKNIAKVIIGKQLTATKYDIVNEFKRNYKPVYQYITSTDSNNRQDTIKSPPDKDDTIIVNGTHYKRLK